MISFDQSIDTRGTKCPMPVLKTKKALANMAGGQVLLVLSSDPASMADLAEFARQTGHVVLEQQATPTGEFHHYIRHK